MISLILYFLGDSLIRLTKILQKNFFSSSFFLNCCNSIETTNAQAMTAPSTNDSNATTSTIAYTNEVFSSEGNMTVKTSPTDVVIPKEHPRPWCVCLKLQDLTFWITKETLYEPCPLHLHLHGLDGGLFSGILWRQSLSEQANQTYHPIWHGNGGWHLF